MNEKIEIEILPKSRFSFDWNEIWRYRELMFYFALRDVKVRYKQTSLGIFWAILQPLMMLFIFNLIFHKGLRLNSGALPYPIFAFGGLLFWHLFYGGVNNAISNTTGFQHVIRKIFFPRMVLPYSGMLVALFDFVFSFLVFWLLVIWYGVKTDFVALLCALPVALLVTSLFAIGFGSLLAALTIRFKDFRYLNAFILQILFFATPVLYDPSQFADIPVMKYLLEFNPLSGVLSIWRGIFTGETNSVGFFLRSFSAAIGIFFLGIFTFKKTEAYFADFL